MFHASHPEAVSPGTIPFCNYRKLPVSSDWWLDLLLLLGYLNGWVCLHVCYFLFCSLIYLCTYLNYS